MSEGWRTKLAELDRLYGSADLWERAVRGPRRSPPPERRQGRRALAAVALAVVLTAVGVLTWRALAPGRAPSTGATTTYTDHQGGWTITYPEGWSFRPFDQGIRVAAEGIRISNFAVPPGAQGTRSSGPIPDLSFLRGFPSGGVLFQLWRLHGGPMRIADQPDSVFPVSIRDLKRTKPYVGGNEPRPLYGSFTANGEGYNVSVWIGPAASRADRTAAAEAIGSWRFLPLTEGTTIGQETTFFVLGRPKSYPVGSVTRFDADELPSSSYGNPFPFYLVHVRDGFFALSWEEQQTGGYTNCDVRYDSSTREFVCKENGARWSLMGTVLQKPGPGFPDDPLAVLLVRISVDGHVLVSPDVSMSDPERDFELTGPGTAP
jgi:hypothetical protein